MPAKNTISEQTWNEQAALYELGFKHGNQIARELGVSPQTVSRQMKRRGAVKGSRVSESVQGLEAALDQLGRTQRQRLEEGGEETGRGVGQ